MKANRFPKLQIVSDDALAQLLDQTYRILEEIGCVFTLDEALDIMEELPGTQVDRDTKLVRIDRSTVQRAIATCPNPFTLHGRNPDRTIQVGGDFITFATTIGAPFVRDLRRGRRPATLADLINLVKIAQMVPYVDVIESNITEPQDVPIDLRALVRMQATFTHCDRPIAGSSFGTAGVEDSMAVADLVFGTRVDWPVYLTIANPISPLLWDDRMCEMIIGYARRNQAVNFQSGVISGITGPVTLPGSISQAYAEELAGITLAQAARPGAPVLLGTGGGLGDMKVGAPAIGSAESGFTKTIGGNMGRYLNLPTRGGGTATDSKVPDAQSGWEKMYTLLIGVLAGVNHHIHSFGTLESFLCVSYENLVMDADLVGMVCRFLDGVDISPASLAFEVIQEVGPQGLYLTTDHTYQHFRGSYFEPTIADRLGHAEWEKRGSQTAEQRAYARWNHLLDTHHVMPLDPAAEREIDSMIKSRERTLVGAY